MEPLGGNLRRVVGTTVAVGVRLRRVQGRPRAPVTRGGAPCLRLARIGRRARLLRGRKLPGTFCWGCGAQNGGHVLLERRQRSGARDAVVQEALARADGRHNALGGGRVAAACSQLLLESALHAGCCWREVCNCMLRLLAL